MRTYKFYYSGSASGNANAYITFNKSGRIKSVRWAGSCDCNTDAGRFVGELSFANTVANSTHDSIGPIDLVDMYFNLATSGVSVAQMDKQSILDIPVSAGERLYFHSVIVGTLTYYATIFVDVAD